MGIWYECTIIYLFMAAMVWVEFDVSPKTACIEMESPLWNVKRIGT